VQEAVEPGVPELLPAPPLDPDLQEPVAGSADGTPGLVDQPFQDYSPSTRGTRYRPVLARLSRRMAAESANSPPGDRDSADETSAVPRA
jgi:hypothetical protein